MRGDSRIGTGDAPDFAYWVMTQAAIIFDETWVTLPDEPDDPDFDGSSLVAWAAGRVGVFVPKGAQNLLNYCLRKSTIIPLDKGFTTRGALLFPRSQHIVAVSLGNGKTVEAMGRQHGVRSNGCLGNPGVRWLNAAWVPDVRY